MLLLCLIFYTCSNNEEQDKTTYGIFNADALPSWVSEPWKGNTSASKRYQVDIDALIKQINIDYYNFRDSTPKPVFWTDSDYCDHVYFYNNQLLKNPTYNFFNTTISPSYLNKYLERERINSASRFLKRRNQMITFLLSYELAQFRSSVEIDKAVMKKLEEKYAKNAEVCLDWINKKNNIYMVPVCYLTMNISIIQQLKEKLEDKKTVYILKQFYQDTPQRSNLCLPFDLIFEYKFIEHSKGSMSVERRVVNPYVLFPIPVF